MRPCTELTCTNTPEPRSRHDGINACAIRNGSVGVGVDDLVEAVEREPLDRTRPGQRRVAHDGVELTGRVERRANRRVVAHVEREARGGVEVVEELRIPGGRDHVVPASHALLHRRPPDGARRAGDEDAHQAGVNSTGSARGPRNA